LLEELRGDVIAIYRAAASEDAVLVQELRQIAHHRGARLHVVLGPPNAVGRHGRVMGAAHLSALAPDIRNRDVFVCGPPGMTDSVLATLRKLGVPDDQCHTERFAFAD
jgi:ferredoxin-NADP reductase